MSLDRVRAASVAADAIRRTWPMASPGTVDKLVRASSLTEHARGSLLVQGEHPARVALVLGGTFVGTWKAPDGRVADGGIVHASMSGPGQFVGVTTLRGAPIISGIDAVTPVTMLTWLSDDFSAITESDLGVTIELLDRSIWAIQLLNYLMQVRVFTTAASRLAGVLLVNEAYCFGTAPLLARGRLSNLAGVTPQMVSRIFRKWEAAGIVRRVGTSGLELRDRVALEAEAAPLEDFPVPLRASVGFAHAPGSERVSGHITKGRTRGT
jgi:CRP-like cAMP-binding protein